MKLTAEERWEAFSAWHKVERGFFSFVPSKSLWRTRARKMGISLKRFNEWADQFQWFVDSRGREV